MSFATRLTAFTLFSLVLSAFAAPSTIGRRQNYPTGSKETGWAALPDQDGATLHSWDMKNATIPIYQSTGTTDGVNTNIKRAVITVSGVGRDCWYYWWLVDDTLKSYSEVDYDEVSIMGPCFLAASDLTAGAASETDLLFGDTTWISGHKNIAPESVETSSYDVIDELVDYYLDTTKFPNLEAIVFAGHSAGGQMTQRYAVLRKEGTDEDRIHYWVANPGSLVWLTEDRPAPNTACAGIDSYKYGLTDMIPAYALGDFNDLGRDGVVSRYLGRNVHYAFGLDDNGNGDTRCQAFTQGQTHLERGQNFMTMLDGLSASVVKSTTATVDYVAGVSHEADRMVESSEGSEKLFKYL